MAEVLCNMHLVIGPVDTASDVRADTKAIEQLTRQQFAALQGIFHHPRVAVTGPAGSGKTVLAMWRLGALIDQGRKAIYLCYNRRLAEYLRSRNPDLARYIHHVDSYFASIVPRSTTVPPDQVAHYFTEELPGLVIDAVSQWPEDRKLEAMIVDEGQDFGGLRLWAVQELARTDGEYLYCSDDRQDVYDRDVRKAIGAEIVFSLIHNCRNTVRINDTGNRVLKEHVAPMPGLPAGVETTVRRCADPGDVAKVAWGLANTWSGESGLVAILSPFRLENSSLANKRSAYGKQLVTELSEWGRPDSVLFSTIKSFKGLEADAVIVIDVEEPREKSAMDRSDLYVACTRGRSRLAILCTSDAAVQQLSA